MLFLIQFRHEFFSAVLCGKFLIMFMLYQLTNALSQNEFKMF